MLSEKARDRLVNWKFRTAFLVIEDEGVATTATDEEKEVIFALAGLFGNPGWGMDGDMGTVVEALVNRLVKESSG